MKKYATGKPPRKRRVLPALTTLPPIQNLVRCTTLQAQAYLGVSLPTIYAAIKAGELVSFIEDGHRFITPASIRRMGLPPDERPPIAKRVPKFAAIRTVGRRAIKTTKSRVAA
jgi:hypothetical protein